MTELLSFEDWKEKQIYNDKEMKEELKRFMSVTDKTTQREIDGMLREAYKWYVRAIESRDELNDN